MIKTDLITEIKMNKLTAGLTGLILGILINSINIETPEPFRVDNPIPVWKEKSYLTEDKNGNPYFAIKRVPLSEDDQREIVKRENLITDRIYNLNLLGLKIPVLTLRMVQDPVTPKTYSGILDNQGNIHTTRGTYVLESAHDARWYKLSH